MSGFDTFTVDFGLFVGFVENKKENIEYNQINPLSQFLLCRNRVFICM